MASRKRKLNDTDDINTNVLGGFSKTLVGTSLRLQVGIRIQYWLFEFFI